MDDTDQNVILAELRRLQLDRAIVQQSTLEEQIQELQGQ